MEGWGIGFGRNGTGMLVPARGVAQGAAKKSRYCVPFHSSGVFMLS
jgi:hypothetical protein